MNVYQPDSSPTFSISDVTVAVYGLGKMGLPMAAVLAGRGADVIGVDIDSEIVRQINHGVCPVENEPGLPELVGKYGGGRLTATTDGAAAADDADIQIVLVPTIVDDDHEPVFEPLDAAADFIREDISAGDLVILESTVPPGTTGGRFRERVTTADCRAGRDFGLAFCPERTSSGQVIRDMTESYKRVVGGVDDASTAAAAALYRELNDPGVVEMESSRAAEAVKVFEGVYRDVNIALANELAKVCEQWSLDSEDVFAAANTQPYCDIHVPGCGVGGHCIPVYPYFVTNYAAETGLLETAREINDSMPGHTVDILETKLAEHDRPLGDARVMVLGLTYRPGVDELRFAPALDIVEELDARGGTVLAHDPLVDPDTIREIGAEPVSDALDTDSLDGVVLATGHGAYRSIDLPKLAERMRTRVFIDGRGFFDSWDMDAFDYAVIGRGLNAVSDDEIDRV